MSYKKRSIYESLNQSDRQKQEDIYKQLLYLERSEEYIDESINNITDVLIDNGYYPIGKGSFRKVYSKDNVNFVIKVANNKQGIKSNSKEIVVSQSKYRSAPVKSILPELYLFDQRYDPLWLICEKVKPLRSASYEEVIKVFPTFFKAYKHDVLFDRTSEDNKKKMLIDVIEDTYLYTAKNNVHDKSKTLDVLFRCFDTPIKQQEKIKKEERLLDIDHFLNSTSYDYTSDLYLRNLGIRNSGNPSPKDFVILDFDTQFKRKENSFTHNPGFISFSDDSDFSSGSSNESIVEKVYLRILNESYGGSHPDETYKYGWPEFDESWLDKKGLTTWDEDRKTVKKYFKKMGMI